MLDSLRLPRRWSSLSVTLGVHGGVTGLSDNADDSGKADMGSDGGSDGGTAKWKAAAAAGVWSTRGTRRKLGARKTDSNCETSEGGKAENRAVVTKQMK